MFKEKYFWLLMILAIFSLSLLNIQMAGAQEEEGDEEIFVSVAPDVLIVMDISGSMLWTPVGIKMYVHNLNACGATGLPYYGAPTGSSTKVCLANPYNTGASGYYDMNTPYWSNSSCTGPFYFSSTGEYTTDCRRLAIAKRSLFAMLDDTGNDVIDKNDSASLGVRVGFMTFGGDTSTLHQVISALGSTDLGTPYQTVYCGAGKNGTCIPSSTGTSSSIAGQTASGATPLVLALQNAKTYLDQHKAADTKASTCRQKFVILISDGADTKSCSGDGNECQDHMYKRRRDSVAAAKQLADAGYRVYVIGFGANMPDYLKNTLNWMAYYGGTNSPETNTGTLTDYNIALGCDPAGTAAQIAACCNLSTNQSACFPSGVSSCAPDASVTHDTTDPPECPIATYTNFKATANDPGYPSDPLNPFRGYAFMAADTTELVSALKTAIYEIAGQTYSFTKASVQTIRLEDESYLYEGSFMPMLGTDNDSFWPGSLKRFGICTQTDVSGGVTGCAKVGDVKPNADWNAADKFPTAADRKVYTLKSGAVTAFNTTNISIADLGITGGTTAQQEAARQMIIAYIREGEQSGVNVGKKLGDIFHSEPVTIGTPNVFAHDKIDKTSLLKPKTGFDTYRSNNIRTTANGERLIMAGTNNAQFHVFKAAHEADGGGSEVWSFIPPNFLPRLKVVAHSTHPTACQHTYFMDGSTAGSDVWWGANQIDKSADDWHTLLVISEGRGGFTNLWSSSASCDAGFSDTYSATYSHHCGYYAFDVTDTTQTTPTFKWKLGGTSGLPATHGTHFAQPWSKMSIGRVLYNGTEKWVGFVGGGFTKSECIANKCDLSERLGKGFFVVDTETGEILWSMTRSGPSGTTDVTSTAMNYGLAGQAATLDYDNDGFVDTAYIADMGGNVWRFKFCLKNDTECTQENWTGERFYDSTGNVRPIYTKPAVVWDDYGNIWVYFGTGDATDPTAPNAQEVFYAVIDTARTGTWNRNNLKSISGTGTSVFNLTADYPQYQGWRMSMPGLGIKILHDPIVFFGNVYFTTYQPSNTQNLCEKTGINYLYGLDYISGAGQFIDAAGNPTTKIRIDDGPPGGAQGSIDDETGDFVIYVGRKAYHPPGTEDHTRTNLLFWHDKRIK
jgi:Tfp pilus tip-associated adhesin PilY1